MVPRKPNANVDRQREVPRDKSLEDVENLPPLALIAAEIVEDLEAALGEFALIAESLAETREVGADAHLFEGPPE